VIDRYQLVRLANGEFSVRSLEHAETFHPVIGPMAEAKALYIHQLRLPERIATTKDEFVIWDVGLGAAANPLTLLTEIRKLPCKLRIVSFDHTTDPLRFALEHPSELPFIRGFEEQMKTLATLHQIGFELPHGPSVSWELHLGDFPKFINTTRGTTLLKPHAIFYDAFSLKTNPAMWTLPVFTRLCGLLDPNRPCSMPTYSRSTILRVTLLLAGFFVGAGHQTGEKEETTIAANSRELIDEPLDRKWLFRARTSTSAEPLHEPVYQQKCLTPGTWERLQAHPQFVLP
jgi:tRNA U34 5-methylaminomethyl-2-thiouridine-forming methyltransferase MnmC